jgi:alpha/beta superfamily hydrolase
LTRDGSDQGKTTVTLLRRDEAGDFEINEAGTAGAAQAHVLASYGYASLVPQTYVATYQAPFLRSSPIGRAYRYRPRPTFDAQTTVRYTLDGVDARATIDGVPGVERFALGPPATALPVRERWILDAPFMSGVLLLPAFRRRSAEAALAPVSLAFMGDAAPLAAEKLERDPARFPKTPKSDLVLDVDGLAHVWFDPATYVVHEVHFDAFNLDAHLVSYAKSAEPAAFVPAPPASPAPRPAGDAVTIQTDDGAMLAGTIDLPPNAKKQLAALVFVSPGPDGSRDFGGDGPDPMYPELAAAFAARGYETLRYDMRGVGKSSPAEGDETWDQALGDAEAAAEYFESERNVDPKNIFMAGYGNGADLALAASAALDAPIGGVVALAPTVISYRECDKRTGATGEPPSPELAAWNRSAAAHDPAALAARSRVPLFVLHPGVARCGETADEVTAYDEKLRAANPRVTAITAGDLSDRFGGRYDADSPANTEEFFPYRFDASAAATIGDWLDGPKAGGGGSALPTDNGKHAAPPPPPALENGNDGGMPNPHAAPATTPAPQASPAN